MSDHRSDFFCSFVAFTASDPVRLIGEGTTV